MNTVLVIEDEQNIAEFEKEYLEIHGFKADIQLSGLAGLEAALKNDYDLVLLDNKLADMDGLDVCRQIRQNKNIPVLIVSGKQDEMDKIRGLGIGSDEYRAKPFNPIDLFLNTQSHAERINAIIDGQPQAPILKAKNLIVNRISRRVWLNHEEIKLTSKEFDVLWLFISHPDKVFSKEDLFREIWHMDALGDLSTVVVHVKKLREKLHDDSIHPEYIQTVWGVGYRWLA